MFKRLIVLSALFGFIGDADSGRRQANADTTIAVTEEKMSRMVFFAVLEGLYNDGVSNEAVDIITRMDLNTNRPEHFIQHCPICHPVFDAFSTYRVRAKFYLAKNNADTFGQGLDASIMKKIQSGNQADRLQAIKGLVDKW